MLVHACLHHLLRWSSELHPVWHPRASAWAASVLNEAWVGCMCPLFGFSHSFWDAVVCIRACQAPGYTAPELQHAVGKRSMGLHGVQVSGL